MRRSLVILTPCLHMLPKNTQGLKDVETRFRQRYLDLILNKTTRDTFQTRAKIISFVRRFLDMHGFLEVRSPPTAACSSAPRGRHCCALLITPWRALPRRWRLR